jgi:hypothetical protein
MVLYITGICTEDCFYCPLSEEKKGRDVIYANERRIDGGDWVDLMLFEATRMNALGTGITGGDPYVVHGRTVQAIGALKAAFGKRHHVHMYTSSPIGEEVLAEMARAGLDEIRYHPPIGIWSAFGEDPLEGNADLFIRSMSEARRSGLDVGIEVPAVPDPRSGEGLRALVDLGIRTGLDFININELESSHTNAPSMKERGFDLVEDSMAVQGSADLARSVISDAMRSEPRPRTVLHLCSSVYKDAVQLRNRLKRTAENVKKPYEVITEDGTLLRGIIVASDPAVMIERLGKEYGIPSGLMELFRGSVAIAPWVLEDIANLIDDVCYVSEVYPTYDALEVERIPL